jgi:hypothetical protein
MAKFSEDSRIDLRLRAQALYAARGCCGNCGKSIVKHGIALVVVHKVPTELGGLVEPGNLWALCEECNEGNMNCFRRVGADWIRKLKQNRSVHVRLGETLKAFQGEPVPTAILRFVADQSAWTRRLRELRYLGWKIEARRRAGGPSFYRVVRSKPWPTDPAAVIRQAERERNISENQE